jgi:hypothetical protein
LIDCTNYKVYSITVLGCESGGVGMTRILPTASYIYMFLQNVLS